MELDRLEELRKSIDQCDEILVKTFEKRMELVIEVLEYKREKGLPVFHPEREQQVMEKVLSNFSHINRPQEIKALYKAIMKISRRLQSRELVPHNIVLVGFMGTGKTTTAKDLAKKLEMKFVDVDAFIEEKTGMTIAHIFEENGEGYFRALEKKAIMELSEEKHMILSCGGGAILNKENVEHMKKHGRVVLLKAHAETILKRLEKDDTRPLLKDKINLEHIRKMLEERESAYNISSDLVIETDYKSIDDISNEIVKKLYEFNKEK